MFCRVPCFYDAKSTAAAYEVAISYHRVRGLYFMAAVFGATIASKELLPSLGPR